MIEKLEPGPQSFSYRYGGKNYKFSPKPGPWGGREECHLKEKFKKKILDVFFILFIYLWKHWVFIASWAFSSCSEQGLLFAVMLGLLIVGASSVVEHRLWAGGLSSGSSQVVPWHVRSCLTRDQTWVPCISRWNLTHYATREVPYMSLKWQLSYEKWQPYQACHTHKDSTATVQRARDPGCPLDHDLASWLSKRGSREGRGGGRRGEEGNMDGRGIKDGEVSRTQNSGNTKQWLTKGNWTWRLRGGRVCEFLFCTHAMEGTEG